MYGSCRDYTTNHPDQAWIYIQKASFVYQIRIPIDRGLLGDVAGRQKTLILRFAKEFVINVPCMFDKISTFLEFLAL